MYYFHIDADGRLHVGAGCWLPPRDVLAGLRAQVLADHAGLVRVLADKRLVETFGGLNEEHRLMRLPKGFDAALPEVEAAFDLLRQKSFVVGADIDLTARGSAKAARDLADTVANLFSAAAPLNDWLRRAPIV
jgi:uncharacterized protein (DUF2461 family)